MRTPWGDLVRTRLDLTKGDLFSAPTAATLIGISSAKAYKDIKSGKLPAVDLNGETDGHPCWKLTRADILEYVRRIEDRA